MKKAFTMIELIFVIVILGILAAVAIPKLNATRDDAEFVKSYQNFNTMYSDIVSYYTAHGKFTKDGKISLTNVTSAPSLYLNEVNKTPPTHHGWFTVGNVGQCLYVKIDDNGGNAYLQLKQGPSNLNPKSMCAKMIAEINKSGMLSNGYTGSNFATSKTTLDDKDMYIKLGGSGVAW